PSCTPFPYTSLFRSGRIARLERDHGVGGRVIGRSVVVGDVRGDDGPGAAFVGCECRRGRQRVGGRATADAGTVRAAVGAADGEPRAGGRDGFAEGHDEVRVERDAGRTVRGRGRGDRGRIVHRRIAGD